MSTPHPDTQIQMIDDMLIRKYQFNIGDIVRIIDFHTGEKSSEFTTIRYPYFYPIDKEQTYVTDLNPIPYKACELELIGKNPNGEKQTFKYLQQWREKAGSKEYRDNWVPA